MDPTERVDRLEAMPEEAAPESLPTEVKSVIEEVLPDRPGTTPRPDDQGLRGVSATWTIPLQVSVSLGLPALGGVPAAIVPGRPPLAPGPTEAAQIEAAMQVPIIHPNLELRSGYRPDFLGLPGGGTVPLPGLTEAGKAVAARLEDGSTEIKYHHSRSS